MVEKDHNFQCLAKNKVTSLKRFKTPNGFRFKKLKIVEKKIEKQEKKSF